MAVASSLRRFFARLGSGRRGGPTFPSPTKPVQRRNRRRLTLRRPCSLHVVSYHPPLGRGEHTRRSWSWSCLSRRCPCCGEPFARRMEKGDVRLRKPPLTSFSLWPNLRSQGFEVTILACKWSQTETPKRSHLYRSPDRIPLARKPYR